MMDAIIDFIKEYYLFITLGVSAVLLFLDIILLFKRSKAPITSIYSVIREWLPNVVKTAEETSLKGEEKLSFAVDMVKGYLLSTFPKVKVDKYTRVIKELIEEILSTPQKKGD